MISAGELLAAYHQQVRGTLPDRWPASLTVDRDGPLLRTSTGRHHGWVEYRDLGGLSGPALDELIERTCQYFGSRGQDFEWKTHSYDEPADLPDRLLAAGFVPGELETVVIGLAEELADQPVLPAGVRIRRVRDRADFDRIGALQTEVWNEDWTWLADELAERQATEPDDLAIFVAEAGPELVSAAWLVLNPGTDFATLWGGATLAGWRGRGIYRTLVARRAELALQAGNRYLQVDASADSAPILQRLGFVAVATTTPYLWTPPGPAASVRLP